MANGLPNLLQFPKFGGEESPGIIPVKLQPSPINFPTSRYTPQRRALEPTTKEKFAPLAPFLVGGVMDLFRDKPETLSDEQYLKNLGADPKEPSKVEQASLDAYKLYGPKAEPETFGADELINILISGSMGRGAGDYATSYVALRKAKEATKARKETARASYIESQMLPRNQSVLLMDTIAAESGDTGNMYFMGQFDPAGEFFFFDPETQTWENVADSTRNFVQAKSFLEGTDANPMLDQSKEAARDEYATATALISKQATSTAGTIKYTSQFVDLIDGELAQANGKKISPLSIFTKAANFGNDAMQNFSDLGAFLGGGSLDNYWADDEDLTGDNPIGGSRGREGTGYEAKRLYDAWQSGDPERLKKAFESFEKENAAYLDQIGFRDQFREIAYAGTKANRLLLALAYQFAAANGQTGRTLSDKDLAYHLKMVGFGATQDPKNLRRNLLDAVDTLIETGNTQAQTLFTPIIENEIAEYVTDPNFVRNWKRYYHAFDDQGNPWQETVINSKTGRSMRNPIRPAKFVYKPFYERFKNVEQIMYYKGLSRPETTKAKEKDRKKKGVLDDLLIVTDPIFTST